MRRLKEGFRIYFQSKVGVYWIMVIALFIPGMTATAQSAKKTRSSDWLGPLAGANVVLFYPRDVNENLINGGDPKILPGGMFGLSYYHAFSPRWAHLFQLRISDHQINYWKTTKQTWHYNGEQVTVKSDSGDYHLKYKVVSMNYMIGWCLNKKIGWHIYSGFQVNQEIVNKSTKLVDRSVFGSIVSNNFTPYPQPIAYDDELSVTYAPDVNGELLLRTDVKINLGHQWMIRPVLDYGIDPGCIQVSVRERLAFYLEVYKAL